MHTRMQTVTRAAIAQGAESGGLLYIMEASGSYNLFVRTANQTNHIHRGSWRRLSTAEQQLGREPPEPGAGWFGSSCTFGMLGMQSFDGPVSHLSVVLPTKQYVKCVASTQCGLCVCVCVVYVVCV